MRYFQLDGIIEESLLSKFMDFCNTYPEDECTIVINSGGGKTTLSEVVLSIINSNSGRFTLISAGCYSAAFYIFYFAKCKKRIAKQSLGMIHSEYVRDLCMNAKGKTIYDEDRCQVKNFKTCDGDLFVESFLTKTEMKKYKKGEEVYFTFKRMKEIFPDVEVLNDAKKWTPSSMPYQPYPMESPPQTTL